MTKVTDARGKETKFTYDPTNRLKDRTTPPPERTDTRTYDFNGNLTEFRDRRNQTSRYTYDVLNRLVTESYPDGAVSRSYDAAGRLVRVEDGGRNICVYVYSNLTGQLLTSVGPFGTVRYERDELGRTKTRQVIAQPTVTYVYDAAGNLRSAAMPDASATYTYDELNRPRTLVRGNGVFTQYDYDPVGHVLAIAHANGTNVLSRQTYTYDSIGNRTTLQTNIAQEFITQPATSAYNDRNQLTRRVTDQGTTTYSYDDNGNLMSETAPGGSITYNWDGRNRLLSISLSTGQTTNFLYDFAGNLIQQRDAGPASNLTQTFVLDEITNVAYQSRSDGDQLSILTGQSIDQHLSIVHANGQLEYGLADAINSTSATVDNTGSIMGRFQYEPFGQTTSAGSSYPFQYTGRVPIANSLYYYRARFYSPTAGRFMSEDRPGLISRDPNLYKYALNAPVLRSDPTGLQPAVGDYFVVVSPPEPYHPPYLPPQPPQPPSPPVICRPRPFPPWDPCAGLTPCACAYRECLEEHMTDVFKPCVPCQGEIPHL